MVCILFTMKIDLRFIIQIIFLFAIFFLSIFSIIKREELSAIILFLFFFSILIIIKECRRYDCNVPYKMKKIKKNFFSRAFTGLRGGVHYVHFMFTYNHEKYNTQVDTPETLECYFGWFWGVLLILYGYFSYLISINFEGYWYLAVFGIPIFTNIIDYFFRYKK